jgi:hypothetical protein
MVKKYVRSTVLQERLYSGLVAPHVDEFTKWHHDRGFKPITIECDLRSLAGWADWMRDRGFTCDQDLVRGFDSCKAELKNRGRIFYSRGPNRYSVKAAAKYITFLRMTGVIAPLPKKCQSPKCGLCWPAFVYGQLSIAVCKRRRLISMKPAWAIC